jgi:hypothetical protein
MRKIFLLLAFLMIFALNAHATTVQGYVSGGTVTFNSVGTIVTFNSVTTQIIMWNNSTTVDCYADLVCRNTFTSSPGTISTYNTVVLIPAGGKISPNMVTLNYATNNLGFTSTAGTGSITYIVTGDKKL